MMGPPIDPVETDTHLPSHVDVAIVGGGIIGICTALALVQRGLKVLVCEKGHLAGEQSSRNWGWCRAARRDPREIALAIAAVDMWADMNALVGAETGFRRTGTIFVCENDKDVAYYEDWLEHARPHQMSSHMIGADETAAILTGAGRRYHGAMWTPTDGRAEPQKAVPAIAAEVRRRGGLIVERCAVRGLDIAAGRVAGIVTERGRVAADTVVFAGGAWSRLFTLPLGIRLPQLKVQATVLRTGPVEGGPDGEGWLPGFAFRKRLDGGYTIANGRSNLYSIVPDSFRFAWDFLPALMLEFANLSLRLDGRFKEEFLNWRPAAMDRPSPFERVRTLDPEPVEWMNRQAFAAAGKAFPAFAKATIAQQWAGMIDATPDAVPVISGFDEIPGFYLATGFSGHGFGVGPAAGRLMADLVTGATPFTDPTDFRFTRFTDGSRPRPVTGV
ncbi:NAD(P)/FAD-dependent oxidoreductase [Methylobrevis albus]|uniref:FAD-binding oxidoreductase n=1 Tax=Methylobrevis albus TaxID=2793297 RepID=A0A931I0X6_9HYPH|nr:FAD-binding oxidoreductase [Methylobrevis albus]MBH0237717.1 FAD-binding oxidoreductase [Methylobrevis albus]